MSAAITAYSTRNAASNPRLVPAEVSSAPFELAANETAIGSAPGNDLVVGDPTVSRRHATITRLANRVRLADLGATNGTYVNGSRISGPVDLNDGDEIRFGAAAFRFAAAAPARGADAPVKTVVTAIALVFAAGFAITMHIVNFDRLQEAAELSPVTSAADGNSSHVAGPTAIATAGREASSSFATPAPAASFGTADHESNRATDRLWLDPLNRYRQSAGLPPVTANPRFSRGDYLHSRYIVKNYDKRLAARENLGAEMHFEDPSKPWYSVEGAAAGRAGDVDEMWNPRGAASPSWAIDNWMQSPFHRLPILNSHLHSVGYGYDCEDAVCIASLNLDGDVDPVLSAPSPSAAPIEYPPNGASIDMNSFDGEWPDPLASCPGYSLPAGYPITIQFGSTVNPGITSVSFKRTTPRPAALETCAFDGNTYNNPDPGTQKMVRDQLLNFGAIVIMPRAPLARGTYSISIVAGGRDYSWSFSVER
jgi:uncharacterized protein YkwD